MKEKKWIIKSNKLFFLMICIIMAVMAALIGTLITIRSVNDLKTVLWNHMASVADLASEWIDGDEIKLLTAEDSPILDPETGRRVGDGSERYSKIEGVLLRVKSSQRDINIQYIYITKSVQGRQVFVVDPDLENPGEFGEEVVYTPAQDKAWNGKTTVDDVAYEDEWGTYYTAWSPIEDSTGHVVGLVGVDFEAKTISDQILFSVILTLSFIVLLLLADILIFVTYTYSQRKHVVQLSNEVKNLSDNLKTMFDEIEGVETDEESTDENETYSDNDFVKYVHEKTIAMTQRLRKHTNYMMQQANIDFLTKVGNTRAYSAEKKKIQESISEGNADFAVAVFDIDCLKDTNDKFGHECGDLIIKSTSDVLKKVFSGYGVYRVGGDEFAVILKSVTDKGMDLLFKLVDVEIESINKTFDNNLVLSVSKGYAIYSKEHDSQFRDVFIHADNNMYEKKADYHRSKKQA